MAVPESPESSGPSESPEATGLPELDTLVGHLLRRAQQLHAGLWADVGPGHLTSSQFAVLSDLSQNPRSSQIELGERIGIDRSTLAEMIGRMEERDLVEREQDPSDRRRKVLTLSASGRSEFYEAAELVVEVNELLVQTLSESDRVHLMTLLKKVLHS